MKPVEDLMASLVTVSKHPYVAFFILVVAFMGMRERMR